MRVVALVWAGGLAACTADPAPLPTAADAAGPYAVGTTTWVMADDRGGEIVVEIWYPARPAEGAEPSDYGDLSIARSAYRDAPSDRRGAPYPLVAFSHGFGGMRYQSTFLTEHLASHGMVVVAPDHRFNTLFDLDEEQTAAVALARPGDISRAVDGVVALAESDGGRMSGLVADGAFAMVGHSFGAWTSLVVGGGLVDFDSADAHCAEVDSAACGFFDLSGVTDTSAAQPDPRVAVTVALAPGAWYTFGANGLSHVARPLVVGGQLDGDMPWDSEIRPTYEALGAPKTLASFSRSAHWGFTDLCDVASFFDDCAGEAGGFSDVEAVQRWTKTLTTAAVRSSMTDVDDGHWLTDGAWAAQTDVRLESE